MCFGSQFCVAAPGILWVETGDGKCPLWNKELPPTPNGNAALTETFWKLNLDLMKNCDSSLLRKWQWRGTEMCVCRLGWGNLTMQLCGVAIPAEANKRLSKNLKRKTRKSDIHRGLWKALTYSLEYRKPHMCICPGKTWKYHSLSLIADYEAPYKQDTKAQAEF